MRSYVTRRRRSMGDSLIIFVAALIGSVATQTAIEWWVFRAKVKDYESSIEDSKLQLSVSLQHQTEEKKKASQLYDVVVSQNEYIKRLEQDLANFKHSFSNTFLNKN